jgi:hypothetical protein
MALKHQVISWETREHTHFHNSSIVTQGFHLKLKYIIIFDSMVPFNSNNLLHRKAVKRKVLTILPEAQTQTIIVKISVQHRPI